MQVQFAGMKERYEAAKALARQQAEALKEQAAGKVDELKAEAQGKLEKAGAEVLEEAAELREKAKDSKLGKTALGQRLNGQVDEVLGRLQVVLASKKDATAQAPQEGPKQDDAE